MERMFRSFGTNVPESDNHKKHWQLEQGVRKY